MPVPTFTVTCSRNTLIAPGIYECSFARPAALSFQPGQFVLFDVPLVDAPSDIQTRALSIASTPTESELLFAVKLLKGGRMSRFVEEVLRPGTEVVIKGPFGFFVLHPENPKEYLFIATSTGVAPFRAQIRHALEGGERRRIDLIYGVRSEEDLFWAEELTALAQKYDNFFLHLALSNPSPSWTGHRGRVQTLVPLIVRDFSRRHVYVCGSPAMTNELKTLCLQHWGIAKQDLHVEGYI